MGASGQTSRGALPVTQREKGPEASCLQAPRDIGLLVVAYRRWWLGSLFAPSWTRPAQPPGHVCVSGAARPGPPSICHVFACTVLVDIND